MVCDFCHKRRAVFYIEQVKQNARHTLNVCVTCAIEKGISSTSPSSARLAEIFAEIEERTEKQRVVDEKSCPTCGVRLSEIKNSGKVGCADCYNFFRDEIISVMKSHSIAGPYTGSLPSGIQKESSKILEAKQIKAKLEESIRNEDYESAAVYRDYLKTLCQKGA